MKALKIILSIFLGLFGLVTLFLTISITFDLFGIAQKQGNIVMAVIYANFVCALLYLFAGHHLWHNIKLGAYALLVATLLLVATFVWFYFVYIPSGGLYEERTIGALVGRTAFSLIAFLLFLFINRHRKG